MIVTPVALLPSLGLHASIGLSSDDPMGTRWQGVEFVVQVQRYHPSRIELCGKIPIHSRRTVELLQGTQDELVLVQRVPQTPIASDVSMLRGCVAYRDRTGAEGRVIYEMPPRWNGFGKVSTTLTTVSWIQTGPQVTTTLVVLHGGWEPEYDHEAAYRYQIRDTQGKVVRTGMIGLPPQSVRTLTIGPDEPPASYSLLGTCATASVIVLVVTQHQAGGVTVEHTQPGHNALLPKEPQLARERKNQAVRHWERAYAG